MKNLNIYELQKEISKKKEQRIRSFDRVLEICHNKIKDASKREMTKIYFTVPEYVVGLPIYNLSHCIEHIINSLKQNGFHVKYYFPKYIYISWDFDEINQSSTTYSDLPQPKYSDKLLITSKANEILNKPKELEHRPNGKFVLHLD
jgi:hypothetical protein